MTNSIDNGSRVQLILLGLICAYAVLVVFTGAEWIRGSDQYWYLADVELLIRGGDIKSNIFYPGKLIRDGGLDAVPNYFFHNGPMLHLSAWVGNYTGAFRGWLVINVVCHLFVAGVILLCSRKFSTQKIAFAVTAVYLVSPIAIWQTINLLQEQFFSGVMAAVVGGFVYRETKVGHGLLVVGLCVGVVTHPIFLVLAIGYALYAFVIALLDRNALSMGLAICLLALILLLKINIENLFPVSFFPDTKTIIMNTLPGRSNMTWFLSVELPEFKYTNLVLKFFNGMEKQFFSFRYIPLNIFTNFAIAGVAILLVCKRELRGFSVAAGTVLGLHLSIVILMQYSPRYQQIVAPVTFIVLAVVIHQFRIKFRKRYVYILISCLIVFSAYVAITTRHQSSEERETVVALKTELSFVSENSRVIVYETKLVQQLGYILKSSKLLRFNSRYLDEEERSKVLKLFRPDYLVSSKPGIESKISDVQMIRKVDGLAYGDLYWYRLNNSSQWIH